jgi:hypothetical protein
MKQLRERVQVVFKTGRATARDRRVDVKVLHTKIGRLTLKND